MQFVDFVVAPIYFLIYFLVAYAIRTKVSTQAMRPYYLPALMLKFLGALSVGVIYYFYYKGGDTINYFDHGSKWIWHAFLDHPSKGLRLIFGPRDYALDLHPYYKHIWFYKDPVSFTVVRVSAFFGLFTFHTYVATAFCFAMLGFSGLWAMYAALLMRYPGNERFFAYAIFFMPSLFFWSSGILKDTLAMGGMGWMVFGVVYALYGKKHTFIAFVPMILGSVLVYSIKPYILLCFAPALGLWFFLHVTSQVQPKALRIIMRPIGLLIGGGVGFYMLQVVGSSHEKYALENILATSQEVARDIYYLSGKNATSRYYLDGYDGTVAGMFRVLPQAINVSLFRPYLWEANNPLMMLSALESLVMLLITLHTIIKSWGRNTGWYKDYFLLLLIIFSLTFGFAVGVSTFNFGSLVRYKIPLLPTYMCALVIIQSKARRSKSSVSNNHSVPVVREDTHLPRHVHT